MIGDLQKLISRAADLAHQIQRAAEQAKDSDAQQRADDLLMVLAALKSEGAELIQSAPPGPRLNTTRITLTLNQSTIDLIEYLRSSQVADPLYGCIDISDESIDWHAAARFANQPAIPQPP